jgi:hypothetical protein
VNGVVFYNPFDIGRQDATDLMDRCCGHPSPDNRYHYHKYPVCVKSPFGDEGKEHSPLIGFAFDGYAIYGPYERDGVMAKDSKDNPLNAFNVHEDKERGWHYHVTPGQFPYIIGGYWGKVDRRNLRGPRGGMAGGPGGGGPGGGGPGGRQLPPHPIMTTLDTDGDRSLSAKEIEEAPITLLKLDRNKDGVLTPDEIRPTNPQGGRGMPGPGGPGGPGFGPGGPEGGPPDGPLGGFGPGGPADGPPGGFGRGGPQGGGPRPQLPALTALDVDKNGTISAKEIAAAAQSLLKSLDKNRDGELSVQELRPVSGGPGGPGRPPGE